MCPQKYAIPHSPGCISLNSQLELLASWRMLLQRECITYRNVCAPQPAPSKQNVLKNITVSIGNLLNHLGSSGSADDPFARIHTSVFNALWETTRLRFYIIFHGHRHSSRWHNTVGLFSSEFQKLRKFVTDGLGGLIIAIATIFP